VKTHLRHLFRKLGLSSRRQLQSLIQPIAETRRAGD
jgi:DNA-binding CsgD family transcriptional regulator